MDIKFTQQPPKKKCSFHLTDTCSDFVADTVLSANTTQTYTEKNFNVRKLNVEGAGLPQTHLELRNHLQLMAAGGGHFSPDT